MKKFLFYILVIILVACGSNDRKRNPVKRDLDSIKAIDTLVALTGYNAYSYFVYKGQPMGYEYELMMELAEHLNINVQFKIVKDITKMIDMLNSGEGDLIAFNLTVTKKRSNQIAFTNHHNTTRQVLVQKRPEKWRNMMIHQIEKELLRSPVDLIGKTVTVRKGSAYKKRLENLSEEIGGDIKVIEAAPEYTTDDLIMMVSEGVIDYTVADYNVARLNQAYYSNIDFKTEVSLDQRIAWAVRNNAPQLLQEINDWLSKMKKKVDYYVIYDRYFKNRNAFRQRKRSKYLANISGKISKYDDVLKEYSKKLNWDWRLLASQMYQESQFKPNAKSWAGAVGLMQLMPATIQQHGVKNPYNPLENIEGGMKHIEWLRGYWKKFITDENEQVRFVLASYNIGLGHIQDAYRLASKYQADSTKWYNNVEKFLLKKAEAKYYNDEVVRYGYCRGTETVNYVEEIFDRFEHYKEFLQKDTLKNLSGESDFESSTLTLN